MFKSEKSGKLVGPSLKPVKVVVEKRPRTYENYKDKVKIVSTGWEIVREINVAPDEVNKVITPEPRRIAMGLRLAT